MYTGIKKKKCEMITIAQQKTGHLIQKTEYIGNWRAEQLSRGFWGHPEVEQPQTSTIYI